MTREEVHVVEGSLVRTGVEGVAANAELHGRAGGEAVKRLNIRGNTGEEVNREVVSVGPYGAKAVVVAAEGSILDGHELGAGHRCLNPRAGIHDGGSDVERKVQRRRRVPRRKIEDWRHDGGGEEVRRLVRKRTIGDGRKAVGIRVGGGDGLTGRGAERPHRVAGDDPGRVGGGAIKVLVEHEIRLLGEHDGVGSHVDHDRGSRTREAGQRRVGDREREEGVRGRRERERARGYGGRAVDGDAGARVGRERGGARAGGRRVDRDCERTTGNERSVERVDRSQRDGDGLSSECLTRYRVLNDYGIEASRQLEVVERNAVTKPGITGCDEGDGQSKLEVGVENGWRELEPVLPPADTVVQVGARVREIAVGVVHHSVIHGRNRRRAEGGTIDRHIEEGTLSYGQLVPDGGAKVHRASRDARKRERTRHQAITRGTESRHRAVEVRDPGVGARVGSIEDDRVLGRTSELELLGEDRAGAWAPGDESGRGALKVVKDLRGGSESRGARYDVAHGGGARVVARGREGQREGLDAGAREGDRARASARVDGGRARSRVA